jgi:hypothetical protein
MTDLTTLIALADRAPAVMIRPDEDQGRYYWGQLVAPSGASPSSRRST